MSGTFVFGLSTTAALGGGEIAAATPAIRTATAHPVVILTIILVSYFMMAKPSSGCRRITIGDAGRTKVRPRFLGTEDVTRSPTYLSRIAGTVGGCWILVPVAW